MASVLPFAAERTALNAIFLPSKPQSGFTFSSKAGVMERQQIASQATTRKRRGVGEVSDHAGEISPHSVRFWGQMQWRPPRALERMVADMAAPIVGQAAVDAQSGLVRGVSRLMAGQSDLKPEPGDKRFQTRHGRTIRSFRLDAELSSLGEIGRLLRRSFGPG